MYFAVIWYSTIVHYRGQNGPQYKQNHPSFCRHTICYQRVAVTMSLLIIFLSQFVQVNVIVVVVVVVVIIIIIICRENMSVRSSICACVCIFL